LDSKSKVELDSISEENFQEMMVTVNSEVLKVAKKAQNKINKLLLRFGVKCDLSLNYTILTKDQLLENKSPIDTSAIEPTPQPKRRGKRRTASKVS